MARRSSRRAARRPPFRAVGRYLHDDLVPMSVLRTLSRPAPIVRPQIVAQPRWSTVALTAIGLCVLAVAVFVGFVAAGALR
jgi:hypothetical protein